MLCCCLHTSSNCYTLKRVTIYSLCNQEPFYHLLLKLFVWALFKKKKHKHSCLHCQYTTSLLSVQVYNENLLVSNCLQFGRPYLTKFSLLFIVRRTILYILDNFYSIDLAERSLAVNKPPIKVNGIVKVVPKVVSVALAQIFY